MCEGNWPKGDSAFFLAFRQGGSVVTFKMQRITSSFFMSVFYSWNTLYTYLMFRSRSNIGIRKEGKKNRKLQKTKREVQG